MTTVSRTAAPRRRPRWKRWRIVVGASLAALVIAAVAGASYERHAAGRGARGAALMYGAKPWNMLCTFVRGGQTTVHELETAPPLRRDVPLTMLSAETRENLLPPALARLIGYGGRGHSRCAGDPPATGAALGAWNVESRAGERSLDRQQSAAGSGGRGARNGPAEAGHHSSQWVIA